MFNDQYNNGLAAGQANAVWVERSSNHGLGAAHVQALMILAKAVSGGALGAIVIGTLWFAYILVSVGR